MKKERKKRIGKKKGKVWLAKIFFYNQVRERKEKKRKKKFLIVVSPLADLNAKAKTNQQQTKKGKPRV